MQKRVLLLFLFVLLLTSGIIFSQVIPNKFNYQVSIRDSNGDPIVDNEMSFRISILVNLNSPSSYSYREEHTNILTANGVASLVIGNGNPKYGRFDTLSFHTQAYFLRVELDEGNGSNFKDLSIAQLLSVPYSMSAKQLDKNNAQVGQVLKWNGTKWYPDSDLTGGSATFLSGDVTGSPTNNKVVQLLNKPLLSTTPTSGQVLKYDGIQWKPDIDNSSGGVTTLAGDVTGSPTSNKVVQLLNKPLSSTTLTSGQVLKYDGIQWKPSDDSDQQTLSIVGNVLSISNGNNINLPNNNATNFWSSSNDDIYNTNKGSIKIGYNRTTDGELIIHKGNEKSTDKILFFGYKIGANPSFGSLANIGILDKGTNILRAGIRYTGSQYELFGNIKSFLIDHPKYSDSLIAYTCIEGPEAAAYERGTSKLINGRAEIKFSEHFGLIINPSTLTIQLTPGSLESKGLAIIEKNATGITIGELNNGTGNYSFDWEVKAVRKGYENNRVIRHISEYQINNNDSHK